MSKLVIGGGRKNDGRGGVRISILFGCWLVR
jgi:hypothetical protein